MKKKSQHVHAPFSAAGAEPSDNHKCSPTGPVRIGQIGIGHNHGSETMRVMRKLTADYEVVGVVEADPAWRKRRGEEPAYHGMRWMEEEVLLATPDLQAVAVETDVPDLVPTALRCIRAGKHVHMDKPGCESLPEFRRLFEEAAERGLCIHFGYMYRNNPAIRFCIEAVRNGWLGRVHEIDAVMSRIDGPEYRAWLAQFHGGALYIFGGHLIDIILTMMGKPEQIVPFQRRTRPDLDTLFDNGMAVLVYPHATAVVRTAVVEFDGMNRRHLTVCGDEGTIEIRPIEPVNQAPIPLRLALNLKHPRGGHPAGRSEVEFPVMDGRYDDQMREFSAIVRGEIVNPWTPEHELTLHELVLRACDNPEHLMKPATTGRSTQ